MATHSAAVDDAAAASAASHSLRTTNRAGRQMQWGLLYSSDVSDASRSGACKLYCHVDLPPSAFDPPARCRRRCGPCDSPCKDCAASAPVTVIIRGACSLRSVMSQIQTQAAQLQALDLNALQPPLGLAGARAVSDILPRLRSLLALALDNNELGCAGVQVISRELKNLTQLQVVSLASNGLKAEGAGSLALVLSSLTGLQTLNLYHNTISDAGAGSLALVLSSLTGLQTLNLGSNSISAAGAGSLALVLSWATTVVTTSSWCSLDACCVGNRESHNPSAYKRKGLCDSRKLASRHSLHNFRPHGRSAEEARRLTPSVSWTRRLAETSRAILYHFNLFEF